MGKNLEELFNEKIKPPKFDRHIGLFGATTLGVGALMGAGVYVLIGVAAKVAGPSLILTYFTTGVLAFFTTLMYSELARIIPRSGGGYTYAYKMLGSLGGFTTGWFLALGSIFASALYAIGFADYVISLWGKPVQGDTDKLIAIGITLLIGFVYVFSPPGKKNKVQTWIIWGNVAILSILIIFSFFHMHPENMKPFFPKGIAGSFSAISIIYISFFGYQFIPNNADEIISPEKTIPKAMKLSMYISISIYVLIALAAIMAIPWEKLASSKAPLVLVATEIFGGKGWIIISIGGILASFGALSSTVISQSRQTYAMGKDRFFPKGLSKLNKKSNQPAAALLVGVILIALALAFFSVQFIAKVANFSLLFSLLPVSIAMHKIYKNNPETRPKAKWKLYLPHITFVINLGLLFSLDIVSLAFGQDLAIVGAVVYFLYSKKHEKRAKEGVNIVLEEKSHFSFFSRNKILVPLANPKTQDILLRFSNALMAKKGGEIVVLAVKNVPEDVDFYTALSEDHHTLDVIKRGIEYAKSFNVKVKPIIRASRNVATGIINVSKGEKCDLIVMGFPSPPKNEEDLPEITSQVLRNAFTDTLLIKYVEPSNEFKFKNIAIYLQDKNNLRLMITAAVSLAEKNNARLTLFQLLPENYNKRQKSKVDRLMISAMEELKTTALYNTTIITTNDIQKEIISFSGNFDLLIIGKEQEKITSKNIEQSNSFLIARQVKCSVIMVKSISPLKRFTESL